MAELSPAALRAVEDAVRAVVAHDDERLRVIAPRMLSVARRRAVASFLRFALRTPPHAVAACHF